MLNKENNIYVHHSKSDAQMRTGHSANRSSVMWEVERLHCTQFVDVGRNFISAAGQREREVKEMKIYGKTFSCSLRCVIVLLSFARHIKSGRESSLSKVSSQSYSIYISSVLRFMLSLTVYACALLLPAWIELTSFELKLKQLSPVTEKRIVLHN